mmetsp:Transcript_10782/g.15206  ORF Transcript_10782/g.15206 Transcript_10782/m.15206 type:complete len:182 (+) Transcript_10782:167-712(+)|eukprot:CAMPEP_0184862022 /NCGR_PEP_ID=MMETSP0580-20130426/6563_1 /TAXON_ID=1118495 /ORGANISM="Dactyliosolen fragilissimus" /LENGTH=181 /DNA_ID=CAMNT_0027359723 /DNA_START=163 /DNA_END=708 /DNA_ORIENTATION=+
MKLSLIAAALACTSVAAFAPSNVERTSTALNMDRRAAVGQFAAGAAILAGVPSMASADGAVSAASINRARGIYGTRIAALKDAVGAGDFSAVAEEKAAFILFNSGAYPKDKVKAKQAVAGTNAIFAAIRSQDKAGLKSAYESYIATCDIAPLPEVNPDKGQGYSNDFDFRVKTSAGAIYVR